MRNRSISLPIAVLFAVVALVIGSFGTATASGLTSSQVKKIAAKVVNKKAAGLTVSRATTAGTADTATTVAPNSITSASVADGSITAGDLAAGTLPKIFSAHISATGTVISGLHVTTASRASIGRYTVTFDEPVTNCTFVAQSTGLQQSDIWIDVTTTVTVDVELPATADAQDDDAFFLLGVC